MAFSSYEMALYEAADLVTRSGWSPADACELVGLPTDSYLPLDDGRLPFTPTPKEIATKTAAIRSGGIVMNDKSAERWRQDREFRAWNDAYDLAGDIDEDRLTMPEWFRG
ncbi:hypothetical protein [Roseiconus lacunae]|uniref:Uncharacterized protein n=1 Tax=Roseiconus lacunae TaxID=2605694 RepID=A0ABT7PDV0_9BACT|nr:hypothetical protein [Roseiconus lacunae]MDM4014679.1 hypothetical protein [Roseiconus lacunae]